MFVPNSDNETLFRKASLDFPEDALYRSEQELAATLKVSENVAHNLKREASSRIYPWKERHVKVCDMLDASPMPDCITLGDVTLDHVVGGGVFTKAITEVVGQSSSGKTQLLMQLLLTVQLPRSLGGLDAAALYVHTEGRLPTNRLHQLIKSYSQKYPGIIKEEDAWNSIYTLRLHTTNAQHTVLGYQLPAMLQNSPNVRLVVIDSIAALYRGEQFELDDGGRLMKASEVCELGIRLKKLADQYNVAVVVANQVTDDFTTGNISDQSFFDSDKRYWRWALLPMFSSQNDKYEIDLDVFSESLSKQATLGLTWANTVNCRIRMARSSALDEITRRILCLEFSPYTGRKGCEVHIDDNGMHVKGKA